MDSKASDYVIIFVNEAFRSGLEGGSLRRIAQRFGAKSSEISEPTIKMEFRSRFPGRRTAGRQGKICTYRLRYSLQKV